MKHFDFTKRLLSLALIMILVITFAGCDGATSDQADPETAAETEITSITLTTFSAQKIAVGDEAEVQYLIYCTGDITESDLSAKVSDKSIIKVDRISVDKPEVSYEATVTVIGLSEGEATLTLCSADGSVTSISKAKISVGNTAEATEKPTEQATEKPTEKPTEQPTEKETEPGTEADEDEQAADDYTPENRSDDQNNYYSAVNDNNSSSMNYVLNTNTLKFHYPDCSSVDKMSEKNKESYYGTRDELIARGYSPCGNCHP